MPIGLVGKKCGMTRVFSEDGTSVPVTVIEVVPNRVTQIKNLETDGYHAVQITMGHKKNSKVNKAQQARFAQAGVEAGEGFKEFRLCEDETCELKLGDEITVAIFNEGQKVDVRGVTRGKGFAGVVKRHHFRTQDATHGNSLSHRAPGSIGQNQTPGRVFKGKKMAGHLGNVNRTVQNQQILRIDAERNLILLKGAVPGAPGGRVIIMPAVKEKRGA